MGSPERHWITGRKGNIPPYIMQRMEALGLRASLRALALAVGVPTMTLAKNLTGENGIKLSTAVKLAQTLDCSIEDLVENIPELLK